MNRQLDTAPPPARWPAILALSLAIVYHHLRQAHSVRRASHVWRKDTCRYIDLVRDDFLG